MKQFIIPIIIYLIVISTVSVVLTVKDKKAAQSKKWRVPEATLLLCGLLGGAFAMLITMKKIRHKTRHIKFMFGLPVEIVIHIVTMIWLFLTFGV